MKLKTEAGPVNIRWMIRRDMDEVLAIERASFDLPWFTEDFQRELRKRNCIGLVAELDARIVGFAVYSLHTHYLEIINFAVHPEHRRRGIGRALWNNFLWKLSPERRRMISLAVREENLDAQRFFSALWCICTGTTSVDGIDGYVFEYYFDPMDKAEADRAKVREATSQV